MTITMSSISQLSDHDLLAAARHAASDERRATAQLIGVLMELDARRLYLAEGYSSLFTYCTKALCLSEHAAYGRIEAARAARRFPTILSRLAEGALSLTAVGLLAPHLTPENHLAILEAAHHKSRREVEHLVARLHPQPDAPVVVRKLPPPKAPPFQPLTVPGEKASVEERAAEPRPVAALSIPVAAPRPAEIKPLAPERYKIQFTVSRETYEQLRRAQDLLRHTIPDGDPAVIFEKALTLLLKELSRAKHGAADRPRPPRAPARPSRHIPAAVKREVWRRDGGQCAFTGAQGRCGETGFLEYHHLVPYAAGGDTTVSNLSLRCRHHNIYEAERDFGGWRPPLVREQREVYGAE